MKNKKIYLDYNATSPLLKEVEKEILRAIKNHQLLPLNPSSIHFYGREGKKLINQTKQKLKEFLNASNAEVIFTASASEANNLALRGFRDNAGNRAKSIIISAIEHSSVLKTAQLIAENLFVVRVDANGVIDLNHLQEILQTAPKPVLISIIFANNEIGTIQPIKEIAKLSIEHNAYFHTDAVQMVGKQMIDFDDLNVDMLSLSAHKFGALQGIGALLIKKGMHLDSIITGGGQEKNYRSGTENMLGIFSLLKALEALSSFSMPDTLRNYLESEIAKKAPETIIVAKDATRLPNTTCLIMKGINSTETLLINFDLKGIMVSSGSACSSGKIEPSHVLKALGYSDVQAKSAIRVSIGKYTTKKEIDQFINAWVGEYSKVLV